MELLILSGGNGNRHICVCYLFPEREAARQLCSFFITLPFSPIAKQTNTLMSYHKYTIMTTNNNRYFAIIFPSALLAVALVLILFMFSGCNAEKRAVKKSDKHFFKALAWDKPNVHGRCSDIAPPMVMTKDSFIYKPGKVIYKQGEPVKVFVDCDTVKVNSKGEKKATIPCPLCDSVRVDTAYVSVRNTEVDRNKEIYLTEKLKLSEEMLAAMKVQRNMFRIASIVLFLMIFVPWIIKRFMK